ncbi:MAG TPA: cytochrome c [Solirubrobacteraceae bacterium]|nr:cytochrome c [Solirubrobacteraceae bacterium]
MSAARLRVEEWRTVRQALLRAIYATPRLAVVAGVTAVLCVISGCGGSGQSGGSSAGPTPAERGRALYQSDGCAGCHSLDGSRGVGPTWKGLAGSQVELADGRSVKADNAFLREHILEPDERNVRGYPAGVMAQAIEALDLAHKPRDVSALVAFIESLR